LKEKFPVASYQLPVFLIELEYDQLYLLLTDNGRLPTSCPDSGTGSPRQKEKFPVAGYQLSVASFPDRNGI
jgi:hypothetical protein